MEALNKDELEQLAVGYAISGKMSDDVAQEIGRYIVEAAAHGEGTVDLKVSLIKPEEKGCCLKVCVDTPWGRVCRCVISC